MDAVLQSTTGLRIRFCSCHQTYVLTVYLHIDERIQLVQKSLTTGSQSMRQALRFSSANGDCGHSASTDEESTDWFRGAAPII